MPVTQPTTIQVPAINANGTGTPTGLPAGGGAIVNVGIVPLTLSATGNLTDSNAITLAVGACIPWPADNSCWAWVTADYGITGIAQIQPIPSSYSTPGANQQILLTAQPAGSSGCVVPIPSSAETLVIVLTGAPTGVIPEVIGTTTAFQYPSTLLPTGGEVIGNQECVVSVCSALDAEVAINWLSAPTSPWYAYSDSGVHTTVDTVLRSMTNGNNGLWTTPIPPPIASGEHPPTELLWAEGINLSTGTDLMGPPGAGYRYRIFRAKVNAFGPIVGSGTFYLGLTCTHLSNPNFLLVYTQFGGGINSCGGFQDIDHIPLSGIPLDANTPVVVSTNIIGSIVECYYTLEQV